LPPAPSSTAAPIDVAAKPAEPLQPAPLLPSRPHPGSLPVTRTMDLPVAVGPPGRLVVTEPMTGQTFSLDRSSMVIGRTRDNDIVLDFKSISRHHAEIVRDGERYLLVDLRSANGVRVNGTEYKRVGLRSGDILSLGHIRLRFEDPTMTGKTRISLRALRPKIIYGLVAVAALGAVVMIARMGETEEPPAPPVTAVAAARPAPESAAALMLAAKEAFRQQKWTDALMFETRAAAISPGLAEAEKLRRAIDAEQQNGAAVEAIQRDLDRKDFAGVLKSVASIPETSAYREQAQALERTARTALVDRHLAWAEKRLSQGHCGLARQEAEVALANGADSEVVSRLLARCARRARVKSAGISPRRTASARAAVVAAPATEHPATPAAPPAETKPPGDKASRRPIDAVDPYLRDRQ
jgi:pSer/pThr/pTyr-binding forkhead associated (FHA) protein